MTLPSEASRRDDLSVRLVALCCAGLYTLLHLTALGSPEFYTRFIAGHTAGNVGALEYASAAALAIGSAVAVCLTFRAGLNRARRAWVALIAAGLALLLAEELNWGQLLFEWDTTGWFARYNDEAETNFHNVTSWLDQKPRAVLNLAIVIGGVIHPLLLQVRGPGVLDRVAHLAPSLATLPAACFVVLAGLPKLAGLDDRFDHILPVGYRVSEVEELFIYVFFLFYILSLDRRSRVIIPKNQSA